MRSGAAKWWMELTSSLRSIIRVYDFVNAIMSLGMDKRVRRRAVEEVFRVCEARVALDVGCGPGNLSSMFSDAVEYLVCIDPLAEMLGEARRRLKSHNVDYVVAVGEHLPLRDGSASIVFAAFSLRDFMDWRQGIDEFARVARCAAILDIAKRRGVALLTQLLWWGLIVPLLAAIVARVNPVHYIRLARSIVRWATPDEIAGYMQRHWLRVRLARFTLGFSFLAIAWGRR